MSYATMRSGGFMSDGVGSALHWIAAPLGAAIGAAGLWLANRLVGKAAVQSALNAGFRDLLEAHQRQNTALVETLRRERIEHNTERLELLGEIRNLNQTIRSLRTYLAKHGHEDIPDLGPASTEVVRLDSPDDPR